MPKTTCIAHPTSQNFVVIHRWQIDYCQGNECAAALLSRFEHLHNCKIEDREARPGASLWQDHIKSQLEKAVLIFKRDTIEKAIEFLGDIGAITYEVENGDRTAGVAKLWRILLNPSAINQWLSQHWVDYATRDEIYESVRPSEKSEGVVSEPSEKSSAPSEKSEDLRKNRRTFGKIVSPNSFTSLTSISRGECERGSQIDTDQELLRWMESEWRRGQRTAKLKFKKPRFTGGLYAYQKQLGPLPVRRAWLDYLSSCEHPHSVDFVTGYLPDALGPLGMSESSAVPPLPITQKSVAVPDEPQPRPEPAKKVRPISAAARSYDLMIQRHIEKVAQENEAWCKAKNEEERKLREAEQARKAKKVG